MISRSIDTKIKFLNDAYGASYYCVEDICNYLEEHKAIKSSGRASWTYVAMLHGRLAKTMKKADEEIMGYELFLCFGLVDHFVHWATITSMLKYIVKKRWSQPVNMLNAEIDYEEGIMYPEFYKLTFQELTDINMNHFKGMTSEEYGAHNTRIFEEEMGMYNDAIAAKAKRLEEAIKTDLQFKNRPNPFTKP